MIYGYTVIESTIKNDWSTDYVDTIVNKIHKVRLFATQKDRDSSAAIEFQNCIHNYINSSVYKFETKEEQGGLKIIRK